MGTDAINTEMADENFKVVAKNKRVSFDYEIVETLEAGIVLTGSEVKSIRNGKVSINEAFVGSMENSMDLFLFNADVSPYEQASYNNHDSRRPRVLLVHKNQKNKLLDSIKIKGMTVVPLTLYFNHKGILKLSIALAKGKNVADKRESIKKRDWNLEKARILKNFNK
ncbi:MAG: SsrA-binding protein SmpB [Holosporales bacterium]|jgi:SsrA-binding protein|nr:SsrA-binding protein SmpB [Holosporales bacterium]